MSESFCMARYLIGIDLGTTNSALAYIDLASGKSRRRHRSRDSPVSRCRNWSRQRKSAPRPLLPFVPLLARRHDLPAGRNRLALESRSATTRSANLLAITAPRCRAGLSTSAKSWLCHAGVDRSAPLLPWSAPPDVQRISPVEASTRYLRHMVEAWNHVMASKTSRISPRKAGRRADRARVVRRRGPQR